MSKKLNSARRSSAKPDKKQLGKRMEEEFAIVEKQLKFHMSKSAEIDKMLSNIETENSELRVELRTMDEELKRNSFLMIQYNDRKQQMHADISKSKNEIMSHREEYAVVKKQTDEMREKSAQEEKAVECLRVEMAKLMDEKQEEWEAYEKRYKAFPWVKQKEELIAEIDQAEKEDKEMKRQIGDILKKIDEAQRDYNEELALPWVRFVVGFAESMVRIRDLERQKKQEQAAIYLLKNRLTREENTGEDVVPPAHSDSGSFFAAEPATKETETSNAMSAKGHSVSFASPAAVTHLYSPQSSEHSILPYRKTTTRPETDLDKANLSSSMDAQDGDSDRPDIGDTPIGSPQSLDDSGSLLEMSTSTVRNPPPLMLLSTNSVECDHMFARPKIPNRRSSPTQKQSSFEFYEREYLESLNQSAENESSCQSGSRGGARTTAQLAKEREEPIERVTTPDTMKTPSREAEIVEQEWDRSPGSPALNSFSSRKPVPAESLVTPIQQQKRDPQSTRSAPPAVNRRDAPSALSLSESRRPSRGSFIREMDAAEPAGSKDHQMANLSRNDQRQYKEVTPANDMGMVPPFLNNGVDKLSQISVDVSSEKASSVFDPDAIFKALDIDIESEDGASGVTKTNLFGIPGLNDADTSFDNDEGQGGSGNFMAMFGLDSGQPASPANDTETAGDGGGFASMFGSSSATRNSPESTSGFNFFGF